MLDSRLLATIDKIGKQIENANELDGNTINSVAQNIPEWQEYIKETGDFIDRFLYCDEIYDNLMNAGIIFELKDGSKWECTEENYKCILHSYFDYSNFIGTTVFQSLDKKNLFKCADCSSFLKSCDDTLNKYYPSHDGYLLFPIEWTNEGIIAWCKKKEKNEQEYEKEQKGRYEGRRQDYLNSVYKDCTTCIHMKNNECEYSNNEDECDDWEEI